MRSRLLLIILFAIVLTLVLLPVKMISAQDAPSITVEDQTISDDYMVVVSEVVSDGQGWLVIHADQDGSPGPVAGFSMVNDGINTDVMVEIDPDIATDTLYAMLHEDTGTMGEYEFPDADPTATDADGNTVTQSFEATMEMAQEVEMEEAVEEMAATGFNFTLYYIMAAIFLAAGIIGMVYIRKPARR
jgi:hypothetical protein